MIAKQAIEAMTRIDEWRVRYRFAPPTTMQDDCRTVMDALLTLQSIEQRAEQMKLAKELPDVRCVQHPEQELKQMHPYGWWCDECNALANMADMKVVE